MNTTTTWSGAVVAVAVAVLSAGCGAGGGGSQGGAAGAAGVGTRVLAGSLIEARAGHQAIATEDGRSVLIVGGRTLTAAATSTAELWRAGRSVPLPVAMREARAGHSAFTLPTGELWIVGGHDASGAALDTTELFDPVTRTFRPGPRLTAPRDEAIATYVPGGFVLAFGRGQGTLEVWRSDLSRGVQTRVMQGTTQVGGRRGAQGLVFDDGELFVNGGTLDDGQAAAPLWIELATGKAAPAQAHALDGSAVGGTLDGASVGGFVIGGSSDETPWTDVQRVRPGDAILERVQPGLRFARERATVVALGRGILVAGGRFQGRARAEVEVVSSTGGTAPALQVARHDAAGTLLADGTVLITGGFGADGLPVGVSELIVPAGVSAPDAEDLYAKARREKEERDRLVAERDAARAEVARLTAELSTAKAQLAAAEARVRDLEAKVAQASADLAAARRDVDALRRDEASLKQQLAAAEKQAAASAAAATPAPSGTTLSPEQARHEFVKAWLLSKAPLPSGAFGITSDEVARVQYELDYGVPPVFVPKPKK